MKLTVNKSESGGVGVLGLLGIVFVVLKLTGFITWSWWWVTAPFWGPLALALILGFLAVSGLIALLMWYLDRK